MSLSPVFLLCLSVLLLQHRAAAAATVSPKLMITSDSLAYCTKLKETLGREALGSATQSASLSPQLKSEIHTLEAHGDALCRSGHVRAGIRRFRQVFVLLKKNGVSQK